MSPGIRRRALPQNRRTHVTLVEAGGYGYRFAYARAADTETADDLGQDYLVIKEEKEAFLFALCDGVSQSFCGDVASRFLGDSLVAWLSEDLGPTADQEVIRRDLAVLLQELTRPATERVEEQPLDPAISALVRDVLEEKREMGSESTFVCGRIDMPSPDFPKGRVVLAWLGDSRLRLWDQEGECVSRLKPDLNTFERWSTRRGVVEGEPSVLVGPLEQADASIRRVIAYSDGLACLDGRSEEFSNSLLEGWIEKANASADSDDIAYLEVWLGSVPRVVGEGRLPAYRSVEPEPVERRISAGWEPMRGAEESEVEVQDGGSTRERTGGTEWGPGETEAGEYRVPVRGRACEGFGDWSEGLSVAVPVITAEMREAMPPGTSSRRFRTRYAWLVAIATITVLFGGAAALALPSDGPLHEFIFGPTPPWTPTPVPALTASFSPTPTPAMTLTETQTLMSTGTATSVWVGTPAPTHGASPTEAPIDAMPTSD